MAPPRGKDGKRKEQINLTDMTEDDAPMVLLFAVHRYIQPDYVVMSTLSNLLGKYMTSRTQSGWEHKFRDWRIWADQVVQELGGAGACIQRGCSVKSERELQRLRNSGEVPRDYVVKVKTNVPKLYAPNPNGEVTSVGAVKKPTHSSKKVAASRVNPQLSPAEPTDVTQRDMSPIREGEASSAHLLGHSVEPPLQDEPPQYANQSLEFLRSDSAPPSFSSAPRASAQPRTRKRRHESVIPNAQTVAGKSRKKNPRTGAKSKTAVSNEQQGLVAELEQRAKRTFAQDEEVPISKRDADIMKVMAEITNNPALTAREKVVKKFYLSAEAKGQSELPPSVAEFLRKEGFLDVKDADPDAEAKRMEKEIISLNKTMEFAKRLVTQPSYDDDIELPDEVDVGYETCAQLGLPYTIPDEASEITCSSALPVITQAAMSCVHPIRKMIPSHIVVKVANEAQEILRPHLKRIKAKEEKNKLKAMKRRHEPIPELNAKLAQACEDLEMWEKECGNLKVNVVEECNKHVNELAYGGKLYKAFAIPNPDFNRRYGKYTMPPLVEVPKSNIPEPNERATNGKAVQEDDEPEEEDDEAAETAKPKRQSKKQTTAARAVKTGRPRKLRGGQKEAMPADSRVQSSAMETITDVEMEDEITIIRPGGEVRQTGVTGQVVKESGLVEKVVMFNDEEKLGDDEELGDDQPHSEGEDQQFSDGGHGDDQGNDDGEDNKDSDDEDVEDEEMEFIE
ncbi:MAG: hypothetical protein L6R39_000186 [Caloplaca ligustica]|nr:MAG: hypothetical protein L6R39_000186 [Caloplaca ligustica]